MPRIIRPFLLTLFIALSLLTPVQAKVESANHLERLQEAGKSIQAKEYKHGYVQFRSMAKNGCPYSQCILGIMHQNGVGAKKSGTEAKYWFQKSARQGFADAQNRLGLMYLNGTGVRKNMALAKRWLTRAANQGVEEARELLAKIPGESNASYQLNQTPQRIASSAENIHRAWQGYSQVTTELNQLNSVTRVQ